MRRNIMSSFWQLVFSVVIASVILIPIVVRIVRSDVECLLNVRDVYRQFVNTRNIQREPGTEIIDLGLSRLGVPRTQFLTGHKNQLGEFGMIYWDNRERDGTEALMIIEFGSQGGMIASFSDGELLEIQRHTVHVSTMPHQTRFYLNQLLGFARNEAWNTPS